MTFAEILVNVSLVCVLSFGCAMFVAAAFFGVPANNRMRETDEDD
jgi:hypothetical protein